MLSSRDYVAQEAEIYKQAPGREMAEPILFGHKLLDRAIPGGISIFSPGCHLIQGPSGSRKTTFVLNMLINMLFSPHLPRGFRTYWYSIESLMTQEHVLTLMRAMIATRILIYNKFNYRSSWEKIMGKFHPSNDLSRFHEDSMPRDDREVEFVDECSEIKSRVWDVIDNHDVIPTDPSGIPDPTKSIWEIKRDVAQSAQFIKSSHRWPDKYTMSADMHLAYITAGYCMSSFVGLFSEGASEYSNKVKRIENQFRADSMALSGASWLELARRLEGNCQFIVDHVTAFDGSESEFEKQRALKPYLKAVFAEYPLLFWLIIQDGVGNQRDRQIFGRSFGAMGGDVLRQEVNVNWSKRMYDEEKTPYWDVLEKADKSRIGVHPPLAFMIAPNSGAYIGEAQRASKVMP